MSKAKKKFKIKYTWYNCGKSCQVLTKVGSVKILRKTGGSTYDSELGKVLVAMPMIDVKEEKIPIINRKGKTTKKTVKKKAKIN